MGYVHIYTGNGKGKTTAAIGLAVRALGAGWRVFFGQFLKTGRYSEHTILSRFPGQFTVKTYGRDVFIRGEPEDEDRRLAQDGIAELAEIVASGDHHLVVLDEANVAAHLGLIDKRAEGVEMVITGRHADPRLLARADLVTEMREVKHYYHRGVPARTGVEA